MLKRIEEVTIEDNYYDNDINFTVSKSFSFSMLSVVIAYVLYFFIARALNGEDQLIALINYFLSYFIVSVALFLGSFFVVKKEGLKVKNFINFKFDIKLVLVLILVAVGTYFGLGNVNNWFVGLLEKIGYVANSTKLPEKNWLSVCLCVLFIAIIPAFVEELLFRGIMLKGCMKFGQVQGILISALGFSLYHMSPSQTLYQFIIGVIFAIIAIGYNSVIPTMILHFLNNFIIILWYYFFPWFKLTGWLLYFATIMGLLMIVLALFLTSKRFKKQNKINLTKVDKIDYLMCLLPGFLICIVMWFANFFN